MLISTENRKKLAELFEKRLSSPVTLVMFTQEQPKEGVAPISPCQWCADTEGMVRELAKISDKITVEIYDFAIDQAQVKQYQVDKIPAIALVGARDYGIRYYGIPGGYEFTSLIEGIISVSRGASDLSPATKARLASLKKEVHIQVLVTLTCPYCPGAVKLAHQMALESDRVRADMVEAQEFPHLIQRYQVYGVPRTVLNETTSFEGARPEAQLLLYVLKAAGELTQAEAAELAELEG